MAQALLALEGCECAMLGVSTPLEQIVQAAARMQADVVALSFSASMNAARAQRDIALVRAQLPGQVELWLGGACVGLRRATSPGVVVVDRLEAVPAGAARA
jgi:methanogenic corrinoid protein MtbC1